MTQPSAPSVLDSWRGRWAYRIASAAADKRNAVAWSGHPAARKVLVVLPDEDDAVRSVWRFLKRLDVPSANVIPVSRGGHVVYAPDDFIGRVRVLQPNEYRRVTGLPKAAQAASLWAEGPEVALSLRHPFDLNAAFLVGASPASFRIGFHDPLAEPFFDFMLAPTSDLDAALAALERYLVGVSPPVLSFRAD
ncbi:MAG: hypothetical protein AAFN13_01995 [Bacteroidota bacterium]